MTTPALKPEVRFSDLAPLASLSPFEKWQVSLATTLVLAGCLAVFYEPLSNEIGLGAVLVILGGAAALQSLLQPLQHVLHGWSVYRTLVEDFGQATACEVAILYKKGGELADHVELERIALRNSEIRAS